MSLQGFTNEFGEHERRELSINTIDGKNFHQENKGYPRKEYVLKLGTKGSAADPDGFRPPKGFRRLIVKITEDSPWTRRDRYEAHPDDPNYDSYYTYHFSGDGNLPFDIDESGYVSSLADNCEAHAINQALNNLRQNRLQFGADVAEAHKTLEMIAGSVIPLAKAAGAAKRGDWGRIPDLLQLSRKDILTGRYPANKWLEYQYGWKPLMGSIYDGYNVLKNGFRAKPLPIFSARGRSRDSHQEEATYNGGPGQVKGQRSFFFSSEVKLYYQVESKLIDNLDSLGVLNPLSIGWELLPYSFVIDWFVPVGSMLSAFSATAGLKYRGGYKTMKRSKSFHGRGVLPDTPDNRFRTLGSSGSYRTESFTLTRTALGDFPTPQLEINPNPFSSAHIKNAIALIRQLF